ncbi:hypothetical protein G979_01051 [Escherichia coli UMEA 3609-1]|uniref:DUF551 domain-containing protein n=1 Tax=Escherichia coli TaxID=562 RepID=A0AAP1RAZ8_ECOLX|nr:hypothetical protein G978_01050 [Escherichia coli UMEA 3592-1]EQZ44860.1 hypothetical protein G979_01051 [Escherichia coli UMEA 3609-1]MBA5597660.1 DUF551 domain-containing protein [Escherichia coli]MBE0980519.1 DUF551 domain-containing protein [Escherichia coli]PCT26879.1 DUF551 domain-containing protein [Escherichia coli]
MTTITKERIELFIKNPLENGLTRGEQMELARIALASLEADPVKRVNSDQMRRVCLEANRHLDKYDAMAKEVNKLLGRIAPPAPVVPEEATPENVEMLSGYVSTYKLTDSERDIAAEIWNACRTAMLQSGNFRESKNSSTNNFREIPEASTSSPVTPALLPGGFTIEETKELHEDLVRSHISKALSGEKMKKKDRDADLRWIHGVIVQAAWFVKASLEQNALSGNYPVTPDSWISCSERMPEKNQNVLISVNFDSSLVEPLICSARYTGSTFRRGDATIKSGNGIEQATHWMPLPEPPQEVN